MRCVSDLRGRVRSTCKDCGGASIFEHGRQRSGCKECLAQKLSVEFPVVTADDVDLSVTRAGNTA